MTVNHVAAVTLVYAAFEFARSLFVWRRPEIRKLGPEEREVLGMLERASGELEVRRHRNMELTILCFVIVMVSGSWLSSAGGTLRWFVHALAVASLLLVDIRRRRALRRLAAANERGVKLFEGALAIQAKREAAARRAE